MNWDFLDVVKSQGAFLIPRPPSPLHQRHDTDNFITTLHSRLEWLVRGNEIRQRKYGDAAYEWPLGRTPTELVEKRAMELDNMIAIMEASSPSECYENEEEILEQKNEEAPSGSRLRWLEQRNLPTPSPSNFDSMPNSALSCHQSPSRSHKKVILEAKSRKKRWQHEECRKIPGEGDKRFPFSALDDTIKEARLRGKKRRHDDLEGDQHKRVRIEENKPRRSARLRKYYKDDYVDYKC